MTMDTSWIQKVRQLEIKNVTEEYPDYQNKQQEDDAVLYQFDRTKNSFGTSPKRDLFIFDPNSLSASGWQKLGLRDKTINTIQNFLKKGGSFKKPEDLQKIYGLKKEDYQILRPFIKIEIISKKTVELNTNPSTEFIPTKNLTPRYSIIEINTADTSAFISLPGIGSKLASRIVNFRNNLGGFHSIDQIAETYGLPDSTFQKIKQFLKIENTSVKKININTATIDELKAHPYIKYSLANPIVAYRNEHGPFQRLEDLKKIMTVSEEFYKKIIPYLTIQ